MPIKTINGRLYWYVEETGEYQDPVTRKPVEVEPETTERKPPQKKGPQRDT